MPELWKREPIRIEGGVPVFSVSDRYIESYGELAKAHLTEPAGRPWIPEDLWVDVERSTRGLIEKYTRSGQRILDAGVGRGTLLRPFDGLDRHGVDISLDYLEIARDAGHDVAFSRIEELPYNDGCFDHIVSCDVIERVPDLNACCSEMLRVLKPGGTLILRVPLEETLSAYVGTGRPMWPVPLRRFDSAGLRLVLENVFGCHLVEELPAGAYFGDAAQMRFRALPRHRISRLERALSMADFSHHAAVAQLMLSVHDEEVEDWMAALQSDRRDLFDLIVDVLVRPLELNAVFQKSYRAG